MDLWLSTTAAIPFFIVLFNKPLGEKVMNSWHAISPWWSVIPVGLFFVYRLMRSNYAHFVTLEGENSKLSQELLQRDRLDPVEKQRRIHFSGRLRDYPEFDL